MQVSTPNPSQSPLGRRLESLVRKAVHDYALVEGVQNLAIALSGGKDSLTLLYLLKAISGRGFPPFNLHAVHVSGAFSCGASVQVPYLQEVCRQLDVTFHMRESQQPRDTLECYSCSRERRRLLFQAAREAGCDTIAFGHHRDDNAQTVLMNLLHKSAFEGLLPKVTMHAYGVTIVRPMIYIAEQDVRTYSQQQGFLRAMCRCPVGQNSMRRRVDELLTQMEEYYPHARSNIANAGLHLGTQKALEKPKWLESP